MKRTSVATLLLLLLFAPPAPAEIYEWRDESGARHFTNRKELVPGDRQGAARVFVDAMESSRDEVVAELVPARAGRRAPAEGAEVVLGGGSASEAYLAGLRDGVAAAVDAAGEGGAAINVVGPLAVASVDAASFPPLYPGLYPVAYPLVTTSFDRGRSRHLTLRMLLQDQFQLDREGPFLYERLNAPGLGPNLQPFLSRGLPHRVPRGTRVIFR